MATNIETSIRDLLRTAKRIAREELNTDNVTAVLAVFDRICLDRDHERYQQDALSGLTRY